MFAHSPVIHPFHLHPELELDPTNFITLCENGDKNINCHLIFGHFGSFKDGYNEGVVEDAKSWNEKLSSVKHGKNPNPQKKAPSKKKKPSA